VGGNGPAPRFRGSPENGSGFLDQVPDETLIIEVIASQEQDRIFTGDGYEVIDHTGDIHFFQYPLETLAAGKAPQPDGGLRKDQRMDGHCYALGKILESTATIGADAKK
jgi:hypothetical protein